MGEEHDREQLLRVSFDLRLRDFESIIRAWRETENAKLKTLTLSVRQLSCHGSHDGISSQTDTALDPGAV
jgi:hypothetical protein